MKAPEPNQFKGLHKKTIIWIACSALGSLLLAAVIFNMTGVTNSEASEPNQSYSGGEPTYMNNKRDTAKFNTYGSLNNGGQKNDKPQADTNYVPPPPEDLFGDSELLNQMQKERSNRRTETPPITQQSQQAATGSTRGQDPKPSEEEQLYNQALESDISIGGGGGNKKKPGNNTQTSQQIQQYRQEAQQLQQQNPYQQGQPGQDFNHADHEQISNHIKTPDTPYTLLEGTLIPATLQTSINSDLPGNIKAIVTRDVYDSIKQEHLIYPRGSTLIGLYDESVVLNQSKLLISWGRIIFPDGRSMRLPDLNTHDKQGESGLSGKVNRHFWKIFGQSALISLIGAGTAVATQGQQSSNPFNQTQGVGEQAAQQIATEFNRVANQVLQRNLSMSPTIEIDAGTEFNIFLAGDISLQQPYEYKPPEE
ncbi:Type IV secretory pathway, VirB10 components [Fodinibius roseus]|uniref:Type IV secretory pathway, VirB10 components n=1 Tax=Fodinibius roseus TaxID=1194090 RepID=A0A1M5KPV6_9BACT|nr:TrbI/VirB10 family protein [Fodinibius roseus]SHG54834.1 Type IV secretory pathway, VirB10 components [Fodinibius roseus]